MECCSSKNDLAAQITAEIKRLRDEIDEQKRIVKSNIKKKLPVDAPEVVMKALHVRLVVLETNLARQTAEEAAG